MIYSSSAFLNWPHWCYLKLNRPWAEKPSALFHTEQQVHVSCIKERKSLFFFLGFYSALSSFSSSSQRKKLVSVHRRAVMWFQCLGPYGIVPSGGKPLRLCWHISTPIMYSRSALSFLLHLSSFLLTAPFFCFACALFSAPGSFTSTHPQHFSSNLLSQQSYLFFPLTTALYCTKWLPLSPKNYLLLLGPARIWP